MPAGTREAPSLEEKRQKILNLIPGFEINPIFVRQHLKREIVLGTVGDRGAGKSASDAVITIVDGMLAGRPAFSNMDIKCDIQIDDATASKYGLNYGGTAHFESQPLVKDALLKLDDRYRGAYLLLEEINIEYANARKALTNTNTDFNEACQQLRKLGSTLIYNVIDEMFIDVQLRALTDIFLKVHDTAFDMDNLARHKPPGGDFHWTIYPMSAYLVGEQMKFAVSKKPLPPVYFPFSGWHGVYNSLKHQDRGIYSMSRKDKDKMFQAQITAESSPEMVKETTKWKWLSDAAQDLREAGQKLLSAGELVQWIGRPLSREIKDWLTAFGIHWDNQKKIYVVEEYSIDNPRVRRPLRELVPV